MQAIRWGIIGTGNIASSFAGDASSVPHASLAAVASRDHSRAEAFAKRFKIPRAYAANGALFEDPEVDAIYVATPHNLHATESAAALRAGKAVLCEKPLTVSPSEFEKLARVAQETGGYLIEGMWSYFLPAVRQAVDWLNSGRIGELRHVRADFGFDVPYEPTRRMYSPELAGGTLLDMGIYPIAFAWLALRRAPDSIQVVGRYARTGVEDDVSVLCDYGSATAAWTSTMRCRLGNTAEWVGTKGRIVIPDFWYASECKLLQENRVVERFSAPRDTVGLNYELDSVCQDLLAGRTGSEVVPLATSRIFQEQLAAIRAQLRD